MAEALANTDPRNWSVAEVARWLRSLEPSSQFPDTFNAETLTESDADNGWLLLERLSFEALHIDCGFAEDMAKCVVRCIRKLRTGLDPVQVQQEIIDQGRWMTHSHRMFDTMTRVPSGSHVRARRYRLLSYSGFGTSYVAWPETVGAFEGMQEPSDEEMADIHTAELADVLSPVNPKHPAQPSVVEISDDENGTSGLEDMDISDDDSIESGEPSPKDQLPVHSQTYTDVDQSKASADTSTAEETWPSSVVPLGPEKTDSETDSSGEKKPPVTPDSTVITAAVESQQLLPPPNTVSTLDDSMPAPVAEPRESPGQPLPSERKQAPQLTSMLVCTDSAELPPSLDKETESVLVSVSESVSDSAANILSTTHIESDHQEAPTVINDDSDQYSERLLESSPELRSVRPTKKQASDVLTTEHEPPSRHRKALYLQLYDDNSDSSLTPDSKPPIGHITPPPPMSAVLSSEMDMDTSLPPPTSSSSSSSDSDMVMLDADSQQQSRVQEMSLSPSPLLPPPPPPLPPKLPHVPPPPLPAVKTKKRVAPLLVTKNVPVVATGNLVDSSPFVPGPERTCPLLPREVARMSLKSAFAGTPAAELFDRTRRSRWPPGTKAAPCATSVAYADKRSDTFWFRRLPPEVLRTWPIPKRWQLRQSMVQAQRWQWQYIARSTRSIYGSDTDNTTPSAIEGKDDPVLPLYGDSDADTDMSDKQAREIELEVREEQAQLAKLSESKSRKVKKANAAVERAIEKFRHDWDQKEIHSLSRRGYQLWHEHIGRRDKLESDLDDLRSRRLPKLRQTYLSSGTSGDKVLLNLCEGMRQTVNSIKEKEWLLVLTSLPSAPPKQKCSRRRRSSSKGDRSPLSKRRRVTRSQTAAVAAAEAGSDSVINISDDEGSSTDGMSDFIDDSAEIVDSEMAAENARGTKRTDRGVTPPARLTPNRRRNGGVNMMARRGGARISTRAASRFAQINRTTSASSEGAQTLSDMQVSDLADRLSDQPLPTQTEEETQPEISRLELREFMVQHLAMDVYDSVVYYVRQMAMGMGPPVAISESGSATGKCEMRMSLRLWTEFMAWLCKQQPDIMVEYPDAAARQSAQKQLSQIIGMHTSTGYDGSRVCKDLAVVSRSLMRGPSVNQIPKLEVNADMPSSISNPMVLLIPCRVGPGAVLGLHDGGIARRAAFGMFYHWLAEALGNWHDLMKMEYQPVVKQPAAKKPVTKQGSMPVTAPAATASGNPISKCSSTTTPQPETDSVQVYDSDEVVELSSNFETPPEESDATFADTATAAAAAAPASHTLQKPKGRTSNSVKKIREENPEVLAMRSHHIDNEKAIRARIVKLNREKRLGTLKKHSNAGTRDTRSPSEAYALFASDPSSVNVDSIGEPVLVNPGHDESESDVMIPGFLASHLKDHQVEGVRFMWKQTVMLSEHSEEKLHGPSGSRLPSDPVQHGCVLAHSMGLGKTLQTISLVYTMLDAIDRQCKDFEGSTFAARRVLILCPPTVQANWALEFLKWVGVAEYSSPMVERIDTPILPAPFALPPDGALTGDARTQHLKLLAKVRERAKAVVTQVINFGLLKQVSNRIRALKSWHERGGVMIMGYSAFRDVMMIASGDSSNANSDWEDFVPDIRLWMLDRGPSLIIADEGHNIKNPATRISTMANLLRSKSRICLTGYPLQNNLEEYWTMVDFCYPNFLSNLSDFRNSYVNPIKNGLYSDSDFSAKKLSNFRMRALQKLLAPVVDRRDASLLYHVLPRKVEFIISCPLGEVQRELYVSYIEHFCNPASSDDRGMNRNLLLHGATLTTICNHPAICKAKLDYHRDLLSRKVGRRMKQISIEDLAEGDDNETVDVETLRSTADEEWTRDIFERHTRMTEVRGSCETLFVPELESPTLSVKTLILLEIINKSVALGERVLVFSRSIQTLDYLQQVVSQLDVAAGPATPRGQSGMVRIDGKTPVSDRQMLIDEFNAPNSPHNVFFISSQTGSLGINLVSASRVIIYDVGWNPLYDEQAVARAYRYGQRRRVYVYRLMTTDTWEERLFANNVFKVGMTRRVVDKLTMGRRVNKEDMKKYFALPPPNPPKLSPAARDSLLSEFSDDMVFASIMAEFHEHISKVTPDATLLANEEEVVTQEDIDQLEAFLIQEKQRLGQVPPPNQQQPPLQQVLPPIADSASANTFALPGFGPPPQEQLQSPPVVPQDMSDVSMAAAAPPPGSQPVLLASAPLVLHPTAPLPQAIPTVAPVYPGPNSPQPVAEQRRQIRNVRNERIAVTDAQLRVLTARFTQLPLNEYDPTGVRRNGLLGLFRSWQRLVDEYLAKDTPGYSDRANHLTARALGGKPNSNSLFKLFPQLYNMDNQTLVDVIRQFPISGPQ